MKVLGIDIGGSAFKGAPVNVKTGKLLAERCRVEIPSPCTLADGLAAARHIADHFKWKGPVGIGFPAIIKGERIGAVGNLGKMWENQNGIALFRRATGEKKITMLNDAAAATLAEMTFGAGRGFKGRALLLTFGTGIGSTIWQDGTVVPMELGHIPWHGKPFEHFASAAVRKRRNLTWRQWSVRVNTYLKVVERMVYPDLIIIGGGVSKKSDKFLKYLRAQAKLVPAKMHNDAGIVGAALAADL
jgi:polyphosphate glucokinase